MKPLQVGVLGSTNGSDLPALVESIENGSLQGLAEIAVIISDNADSGILEKARQYNIPHHFMYPKAKDGKKMPVAQYNDEIDGMLQYHGVELIENIGWMRLFSPKFVREWWGKNQNIHPSLLPMFAGGMDLDVHKEVLKRGACFTGCTLHYIDEGADTGPIILQYTVPVNKPYDTADHLKERVQTAEQMLIPFGVQLQAEKRLTLHGTNVIITDYDGVPMSYDNVMKELHEKHMPASGGR